MNEEIPKHAFLYNALVKIFLAQAQELKGAEALGSKGLRELVLQQGAFTSESVCFRELWLKGFFVSGSCCLRDLKLQEISTSTGPKIQGVFSWVSYCLRELILQWGLVCREGQLT